MQIEVQLIGEEEVQSSFGLFRETVFKPLEEVFDIAFSGKRETIIQSFSIAWQTQIEDITLLSHWW